MELIFLSALLLFVFIASISGMMHKQAAKERNFFQDHNRDLLSDLEYFQSQIESLENKNRELSQKVESLERMTNV